MAELTKELIKQKGHFTIEARNNFVPGVIVIPGYPPVSADPHRGLPASPGILIRFSKGMRRTFDVNNAADEYAVAMLAAERGERGPAAKKKHRDIFIREVTEYLSKGKGNILWEANQIELYRSPEEMREEAKIKMLSEIPEDDHIAELVRKGVIPEGLSREQIQKTLRAELKQA